MTNFCSSTHLFRQTFSPNPFSAGSSPVYTMSRRDFLAAAGSAVMASALWPLDQVLGADAGIAPAGNIGELNATGAGGIADRRQAGQGHHHKRVHSRAGGPHDRRQRSFDPGAQSYA